MEKLRKHPKWKSVGLLLLLLGMSGVLIYWEYLFGDSYFVFCSMEDVGNDTGQQYIWQYYTLVNHIRQGDFSMWDFTNGLGANMYQLNLFDPSLVLLYILGILTGPDRMVIYLVYIQILRILAAGLAGYLFLSEFPLSEKAKVFASYIYGLNGFLLVWGQHYQFGMVTVYLPLMLMMAERSWKAGKVKAGLPFVVFLTVLYSTYFSYMCCVTAGLYLVFRFLYEESLPLGKKAGLFFRICFGMLLGIGMGLCSLLPSAYVIFGASSRMDSGSSLGERLLKGFVPRNLSYYKTLLYRLFSANLQNLHWDYSGDLNYYEDPSLFASIYSVLLGVQFLVLLKKGSLSARKKRVLRGAAVFMAFAVLLPLVGIIYNGFNVPFSRHTFALMPFAALLMAWMADYFMGGGKCCRLGLVGVAAVGTLIYTVGYLGTSDKSRAALIAGMGAVALLAALGIGLLEKLKTNGARKKVLVMLMLLAVADMCLEGKGTVTGRISLSKKDILYLPEVFSQDVQDALDYIESIDGEFYRVEKTYLENILCMSASAQGYYGVSTYNSVQNGYVKQFVELTRPELCYLDRNHYRYAQVAEDGSYGEFLGVRYLLCKGEEPSGYEKIASFGEVDVYRCRGDASLGRFYGDSQVTSEKEFKKALKKASGDNAAIDELLLNSLAVPEVQEEGNKKETKTEGCRVSLVEESGGVLTGTVDAGQNGYLLFTIPYEAGWTVYVDGEARETVRGNIGFTAVKVEEGKHELRLIYHVPLQKEGLLAGILFWILYLCFFGGRRLRLWAVQSHGKRKG